MFDYQSMINQANQLYNQTVQGYQTALAGMQQQQNAISEGYNTLQSGVLGTLEAGSAEGKQAIEDKYNAALGSLSQNMISRGLGNTTVGPSLARGYTLDFGKAETDRLAKFANLAAGYQSQIGLAGLGYRGNALEQQRGLQQAQLGYMGSTAQNRENLALGYARLQQDEMNRLRYGGGGGGGSSGGSSGMPQMRTYGSPSRYYGTSGPSSYRPGAPAASPWVNLGGGGYGGSLDYSFSTPTSYTDSYGYGSGNSGMGSDYGGYGAEAPAYDWGGGALYGAASYADDGGVSYNPSGGAGVSYGGYDYGFDEDYY